MSAINSINQAQSAVERNIQQLSSGKRINSAADDPAGFAIASQMSVKISSTGQALSNIDNGVSMLETASSGLGQVAETLQTIRDLTVQSGNGILNAEDRQGNCMNVIDSKASKSKQGFKIGSIPRSFETFVGNAHFS